MRSIKILILIIAYIYILTISVIPVQAELTVEDISKDLRCQCGCAKVLADCAFMNCGIADKISMEIKQMISEGKSKEQIIESLKLEYGREIYATPPKKGFDWSLWILPAIGVLIGAFIIYQISTKRMDEKEILEYEYQMFLEEREENE